MRSAAGRETCHLRKRGLHPDHRRMIRGYAVLHGSIRGIGVKEPDLPRPIFIGKDAQRQVEAHGLSDFQRRGTYFRAAEDDKRGRTQRHADTSGAFGVVDYREHSSSGLFDSACQAHNSLVHRNAARDHYTAIPGKGGHMKGSHLKDSHCRQC